MKNKILTMLLVSSSLITSLPVYALTKEETVYTNLNTDGTVNSTTVNEHLINKDDEIKDVTDLTDIFNLNGDEKFDQDGDNLIWKADGKDIYYQGKTDKQLPIEIKATYKLDGKKMDIEDMIGKKGQVTIELKFTNTDKKEVTVNGKKQTMYTPFVVTAATVVSNKENTDFKVNNGRIISSGTRSIIAGISSPGLKESLGLSNLDFDKTVITYNTEKFELNDIYIMATSKILEDSDLDIFDNLNEIYGKTNELNKNTDKLVSGSKELYDSLKTYNSNYKLFNKGVNDLKAGTSKISSSYTTIDNGINSLNDGIQTLLAFKSGINDLSTNVSQISASTTTLAGIGTDIESNITKTIALLNSNITDLEKSKATLESTKAELSSTLDSLNNIKSTLTENSLDTNVVEDEITKIKTRIASIDNSIKELDSKIAISKQTLNSLNSTGLATKITTLSNGLTSLDQGVKGFTTKLSSVTDGIDKLAAGSSALTAGSSEFKTALNTLDNSVGTLVSSSNKLLDGSTKIEAGTKTLYNGLKTYDEQGIKQIVSYINNDLKNAEGKTRKLVELGNEYNTFTMTNTEDSSTKFVMVMDGVKENKVEKKVEKKEEKTSVIDKIKSWFSK